MSDVEALAARIRGALALISPEHITPMGKRMILKILDAETDPPTPAKGHRDLKVGDFGWWHCRACGRRGDDFEDPADFPCEPQA